jgi:hypothetical protein
VVSVLQFGVDEMSVTKSIKLDDLKFYQTISTVQKGSIVRVTFRDMMQVGGEAVLINAIGVRCLFPSARPVPGIVLLDGDQCGQFKSDELLNGCPAVDISGSVNLAISDLAPMARRFAPEVSSGSVCMVDGCDTPCLAVFGMHGALLGYMILKGDHQGDIISETCVLAHLGRITVEDRLPLPA